MLFTSSGSMHKPMLRACLDEFLASKATFACCFLHVQRVKSTVFTKQVPPSSRPKLSLPSLRSKCRLHRVQRVKSTVFTKQVPPSSRPKSQVYRLYEASAAFITSKESSLPSLRSKCRLHHVQRVKSTVFMKQVPTQQDTALWLYQPSRSYGCS